MFLKYNENDSSEKQFPNDMQKVQKSSKKQKQDNVYQKEYSK